MKRLFSKLEQFVIAMVPGLLSVLLQMGVAVGAHWRRSVVQGHYAAACFSCVT